MVQDTYQRPQWWQVWMPLLLVGGLLVLEPQAPLSPGGHQVAQFLIVLLMYGVFMGWLWCYRGACLHEEYEREQAHAHARKARQQRRECAMSTSTPWEDTSRSWYRSNGHNTAMLRRQ
jgi:hypothetical protein